MLTLFFRHKNYMIVILTLLSCSILCQILIGVLYRRLIRETENMSATKNKSLQKLKLKFTSCRQLHETIPNVGVFVDKYINQLSIGRISVSFFRHLSGQLTLLSVLTAGIGACLGIIRGESILEIAPFYLVSFFGLYVYFAVSSLTDIPGKISVLRTNLIDYLENHLAGRLEQTKLDMRLVGMENDGKESADAGKTAEKQTPETAKTPQDDDFRMPGTHGKEAPAFTPSEARELEQLLQEFMA
ncbi:MAG: hypothetical protein NC302_13175 [Bacteroidales bacterium]|nr:hypothetical protein [Bacteroidales bacterium]MCM1415190.1 hypothetical protein [bacterium]MCM1424895.1 hypothetical protein [bacterium]